MYSSVFVAHYCSQPLSYVNLHSTITFVVIKSIIFMLWYISSISFAVRINCILYWPDLNYLKWLVEFRDLMGHVILESTFKYSIADIKLSAEWFRILHIKSKLFSKVAKNGTIQIYSSFAGIILLTFFHATSSRIPFAVVVDAHKLRDSFVDHIWI